jgi:hypothetical protein
VFSPGRGPCSLGTSDLLGFPSNRRCLKVSIFPRLPSHPLKKRLRLPANTLGISGYLPPADWLSSFEKDASPSGLFHRLSNPTFLSVLIDCHLFFQRDSSSQLPDSK